MSAGSNSLASALRTCKVNPKIANQMYSARSINSHPAVDGRHCCPWNGVDTMGRPVMPYSFNTNCAGGSNPMDRISVENNVSRPHILKFQNTPYWELDWPGTSAPGLTVTGPAALTTPSFGGQLARDVITTGCGLLSDAPSLYHHTPM